MFLPHHSIWLCFEQARFYSFENKVVQVRPEVSGISDHINRILKDDLEIPRRAQRTPLPCERSRSLRMFAARRSETRPSSHSRNGTLSPRPSDSRWCKTSSPHSFNTLTLHQNAFNASMPPVTFDPAKRATCTTCQAADDFSNYWTATLYFRARNGTFKRVPQKGNVGFEGQRGGMTVYYMQNHLADYQQRSKVTAFRPVSTSKARMLRGCTYTDRAGLPYVCRRCYRHYKGASR